MRHLAATEQELADRTARFLKAELKRAGVTYAEPAKRIEAPGLKETEASIANDLSRRQQSQPWADRGDVFAGNAGGAGDGRSAIGRLMILKSAGGTPLGR
ncbi:MAG: DUF6471 domain-containing protein [Pseudomonadota bacterium]|nr:DUF6471 domain-containing protein [Pseudomonadota bacterium]